MIKILTPPFSVLYTQLNPGLQRVKKSKRKHFILYLQAGRSLLEFSPLHRQNSDGCNLEGRAYWYLLNEKNCRSRPSDAAFIMKYFVL